MGVELPPRIGLQRDASDQVAGQSSDAGRELDPDEELVMQCKSGVRSGKAADFLRSVGFKRVLNLKGGILDWIDKVDPSQPKY